MGAAAARQMVSIGEIKDRLIAQIDAVVSRYAPEAAGSYHKGALYYTLNPGRADNNVGSFCIHMSGPDAGRWVDFACAPAPGQRGQYLAGDLIDLIGLSLGLSTPAQRIAEARRFLGLDSEDPRARRVAEAHAARLKAEREAAAAGRVAEIERRRRNAEGLWLSAQAALRGTPVDLYLRGRGIDLSLLGHAPGAIRYHPECWYSPEERQEHVDPETGEITTRIIRGVALKVPAMLTAISLRGKTVAVHRTYLRQDPVRGWVKHTGLPGLPKGKWVSGDYTGGCVRLSNGLGPRGGRGSPLSLCPPGTRVMLAEGIENGLSALILRRMSEQEPMRVLATGMIHNLGAVELPENVSEVILAADNDRHPSARAALDRAVQLHQAAGRLVRVWRSEVPGEDLNDALRRVLREMEGTA